MEVNFTIDLFKDHPLLQTIPDNTDVDCAAEPFKLHVFQVDMSSVKKANSANVYMKVGLRVEFDLSVTIRYKYREVFDMIYIVDGKEAAIIPNNIKEEILCHYATSYLNGFLKFWGEWIPFLSLKLTDESEVVDDCITIPCLMISQHRAIICIAPHRKSYHKPNKTRIRGNSCYGKFAGQKPVERRIYQKYNKMILYPKS